MLTRFAGFVWRAAPAQLRRWLARGLHTTFTISAAGIITNEDGQVLLLHHILRSTRSGWGVPGGFIGIGEQPDVALRREIKEETGLDLTDIRLLRCRTLHRHLEVIMSAKAVGQAEIKSREINDIGWYSLDDLPPEMSCDQVRIIRATLLGQTAEMRPENLKDNS